MMVDDVADAGWTSLALRASAKADVVVERVQGRTVCVLLPWMVVSVGIMTLTRTAAADTAGKDQLAGKP
jgi:hypothetical protein